MNWSVDDYLDIEENDLEWFEGNPDRILRRRTAFTLEKDLLSGLAKIPSSERIWALVLREYPNARLYYIDPEDFYDYGEPAANDDYTLMQMWDEMTSKGARTVQIGLKNGDLRARPIRVNLEYLLRFKAAMIGFRKRQRATLKLN